MKPWITITTSTGVVQKLDPMKLAAGEHDQDLRTLAIHLLRTYEARSGQMGPDGANSLDDTPAAPEIGFGVGDAARRLGVSPRTVRRRVAQGLIGHRREGRRLVFTESDIEEYIECHRSPATRPPR